MRPPIPNPRSLDDGSSMQYSVYTSSIPPRKEGMAPDVALRVYSDHECE